MSRSATRLKLWKDSNYLRWLHDSPCVVCELLARTGPALSQRYPTEAAHVGERGLSQKCPDREAIPLCVEHHREGRQSAHQMGKRFWAFHGLDKDQLIQQFNREYDASLAKPFRLE